MSDSSEKPDSTKVPGFGLPLNYWPAKTFPSALNPRDFSRTLMPVTTLRELRMLQVMNSVTDKPNWQLKVYDAEIIQKWTEELSKDTLGFTPAMMKWVIEELRYKSSRYHWTEHFSISLFNGDVVKSDEALPESFAAELQQAVKALEDVPERLKDWHPGSYKQVLDLVHPSLFPLVFGRTRVLETGFLTLEDCISRCGEGSVISVPSDKERVLDRGDALETREWEESKNLSLDGAYSKKFQWLPCEVDISDWSSVKITSYINGLHPQRHKDLYALIGRVIHQAIPRWELSLAPALEGHWPLRIHYNHPRDNLDENDEPKPAVQPDAGTFHLFRNWVKVPKLNFRNRFAKEGLQVIVKLANIVLTPEKPDYPGGSWHLEGQLNEHICATSIYYYSNENIKSSRLDFRQHCSAGDRENPLWDHEQWDTEFLEEIYGCTNFSSAVQVVGGVETRQGRLLTFPNILQHQVQPFSLEDPSKPGHRKILALFLVDPYIRVLSTAKVPPQRKDWWLEYIRSMDTSLNRFPPEIRQLIFDQVEDSFSGPFGMDEAKKLRKELMEERKDYSLQHSKRFESFYFSLCEH